MRDSILGQKPHDWDITTNALPKDTKELFSNTKVIDTGLKHGTVTIIIEGKPVEVTTYRLDGNYTDSRRPDSVTFTNELALDLSRRDFTINAMAYNPKIGLIDKFNSLSDLNSKLIRAVGNADTRFSEDALRIMRALRFSSSLGFNITEDTAKSIHKNKDLLKEIAAERIFSELNKLIVGKKAGRILLEYRDVFSVFIPEILPTIDQKQCGEKHCYNVWEHICHTVDNIEPVKELRLTMLLHDLGKAETAKLDEYGNSIYPNHAAVGAETAKNVLSRLKSDNKTLNTVVKLVSMHDFEIPKSKIELKRLLKTVTPNEFEMLLKIKTADRGALSPNYRDVSKQVKKAKCFLKEILADNECYSLQHLNINGDVLSKKGFTGVNIGKKLDELLEAVIEGKCQNTRKALLEFIDKNTL